MKHIQAREIVEALSDWLEARDAEHLSPAGMGAYRRELEEDTERRKQSLIELLTEYLPEKKSERTTEQS